MRMTVIGMKFNQAEKKNVACDVMSPRGTNPQPPPLRNCTWQVLISSLMDQTEYRVWCLI